MRFLIENKSGKKTFAVKTFNKNFNFVDYLKKKDFNEDKMMYSTLEIFSSLENYFSGGGAKRIKLRRIVQDHYRSFEENDFDPVFPKREILERYAISSKKGKFLDSFYFRKIE